MEVLIDILLMVVIAFMIISNFLRKESRIIILYIALVISFIINLFNKSVIYKNYKQGQIDALNGKIKYELVVNPDSSKVWQKKE